MFNSDDTETAISFEKVKPLYENGTYGILVLLLACLFVPIFLWHETNQTCLLAWFTAILFINVPRLFLIKAFHHQLKSGNINAQTINQWKKGYYLGFFLSGSIWSLTVFFPFQENVLTNLIFITLILVSLNSSAIAIYNTSFLLMISYLSLSMIPLSIRFFSLQAPPFLIMGLLCVTYYIMMFHMVKSLNQMIMENIKLKLDNETMSLKDPLTGLANRRRLYLFIDKLVPASERQAKPFSIVLMDLDSFKQYNDTRGHNAGDQLLCQVASILKREIREGDLAVRYGGEEFLLVLPNTTRQVASHIAERIRKVIQNDTLASVSAGIADYIIPMSFEELTQRADLALYQAKARGKNQILDYAHLFNYVDSL